MPELTNISQFPIWRALPKTLTAAAYAQYDAVLQVVAGEPTAPHAELFAAAAKKRHPAAGKTAPPPPMVVTTASGTAVARLDLSATEDTFARLQQTRKALAALLALSPKTVALDVRASDTAAAVLYTALVGAASLPGATRKPPTLTLATHKNAAGITDAAITAKANTLARALAQLPPNELTPPAFVRLARRLAKQHRLSATVWTAEKLRSMGAGAISAVGRGSAATNPPAIVHLSYRPKQAARRAPIALVGKGVCFDTGGVNVKPARYMRGMSKDMAGAAVTLATIVAAAEAALPVALDAWLVLAENAVSATAYRPDEVITALNGKRIEIIHTDAEGRMILADALTLASRQKPRALISYATLTGTMHVALGQRMSGLFVAPTADADDWQRRALAAARTSGERLCYFPMPQDYRDALDSDVADIKQCAEEGEADHIAAALFLREFIVGELPWLHLDLSSVLCKGGLGAAPGALTGFGVAWTLALLRDWADA